MADFVAVLRRAIDNLEDNSPDTRAQLYDRARAALLAQLRALDPPVSDEDLAHQAEALDLAIARLEQEYSGDDAGAAGSEEDTRHLAPGIDQKPAAVPPPSRAPEPRQEEKAKAEGQSTATKEAGTAAAAAVASARTAGAGGSESVGSQRPRREWPEGEAERGRPRETAPERDRTSRGAPDEAPRPRDGQHAGEEAAARTRAAAAAYEAEQATAPKRRGRRPLMWGAAALVVLALALFGLWQSDLIFSTADRTLDRVASEDRAPDEGAPQPGTEGEAQSEFTVPPAEPEPEAGPTAEEVQEEVMRDADEDVPAAEAEAPPAAGEEPPALTDQPTPAGASAQALLIEEAEGGPGNANTIGGSVRWEVVSENGSQGPGQAISGTVRVPDREVQLSIMIRRNTDADLPASHTIELVFDLPEDFGGGGIANVPGLIMKATPRASGQPLVGAVVPVTESFFLVGLSESDLDRQRNVQELLSRDFIDIPVVYENGGRAVLSIAKGEEGRRVFQQAFEAWN
ncbi:hypothetical protein [Lutibaculum baratangense]|uniref:CheA signal transduction histidine kinase n=1 Tax=Lutibaculum baratangense AMV1 TaxID=631454 RepID=V4TMT8_9HYPH|nr:hypothetical protein [Lutibaculum baratangense]ESR27058.1 hypothetical protein N177_0368 [Lutibaculum baratangense AMV1]